MNIIVIVILGVFALLVLVLVSTKQQNGKWGINIDALICPRCKEKLPVFRNPKSVKQFLWGGWTCHKCGCEIDKWGQEIQNV